MMLEEAKAKKIYKVLIGVHENNIASWKTVEKCGGLLENTVTVDGVLNSNFWNADHQKEISDGKYIDTEKVKLRLFLNTVLLLPRFWEVL